MAAKEKPSVLPRALLILFGAALFLDIPASRAYYEHNAWTEQLGRYLFHGIHEVYKIPLSFTLFEVLSYAAAGLILVRWGSQRSRFWLLLALSAMIIPLACAFGAMTGVLRGNTLSLAFSQLHFIPMIPVWMVIGYYLGTRPIELIRAARILFWVCIWRSLYAIYVFLFVYSGTMGTREFLIDHASSSFLAVGLGYAALQGFTNRHRWNVLLFYSLAVFLMLWPYLLNDRRTSFVGLLAVGVLLPLILPLGFRLRLRLAWRWAMVFGLLALFAKATLSQDAGSIGGALRSLGTEQFEQLDYRQIENYNLMIGVIETPLLGLGFGRRFPQAVPLADISFSFELFDAIPHNTMLFMWTFAGPLGIAALVTASTFIMTIISRVGIQARTRRELMLAMLGLIALLQWIMYVSFDMGLLESRISMLLGVFAGGLFPVYGRILVEQAYAKYKKSFPVDPAAGSFQPVGVRP